jgi:hypothetical protein
MNDDFQDFMEKELEELKEEGLYNTIRTLEVPHGT